MTCCFKLFILLGFFAPLRAFSYDYKFMGIDCKTSRSKILNYDIDVALKLYGGSSFNGYGSGKCTAVLEAENYGEKLILKFSNLNLAEGDTIDVYDGSSENSRKLTDAPLSGVDADFDEGFKSSGKYLTVVVNSAVGSTNRDGFDAIVTEFETDYCFSYDYECCDGGCIDSSLRNDLENNCVDSSDEWNVSGCLSIGKLAGVIVGTLAGVVLIVVVVTVCICWQQKKARARRQNMHTPAPGTYPVQPPVHYAVQTQQTYPVQPPMHYSVQTQQVGMGVYPPQQQYYAPPPQAPYNPPAYPVAPLQQHTPLPPTPGQGNPSEPAPAHADQQSTQNNI